MIRNSGCMKRNQSGFTLLEILVVMIAIGILVAVVTPTILSGGVSTKSKAQLLNRAATELTNNLAVATNLAGLTVASSGSLAASGNNVLDILMVGDTPAGVVATTYTNAFAGSGLRPLAEMGKVVSQPTVGTAGSYTIGDYAVSATSTNCAAKSQCWQFAGVPTEVLESLWLDLSTGSFDASTAVTASTAPVKYTAAANGTHTVTLQKRI